MGRRAGRSASGLIALAVTAALALSGCAAGPDPVAAVTALAEETHAGQLRLVAVRQATDDGAAEVVFALVDDADAAVVVTVGGERESTVDEEELRSAVQTARERADRYRRLVAAFRPCGYAPVAVHEIGQPSHEVVWIAADDATGPLDRTPVRLQPCREDWWFPDRDAAPAVNLVDPTVLAGLPRPDPDLPPVLRATDRRLGTALKETFHHAIEVWPAAATPPDAHAGRVRPVWPAKEWQTIAQGLRSWIDEWLDGSGSAQVSGLEVYEQRWLIPGTSNRMRYYEAVCTERETSWRCVGPMVGVVAVTVDLDDFSVAAPRLITDIRQWRDIPSNRPLEPELAPPAR
ncbi:hypothetical protein [Polymorphospora rubra]|uniref:Lipoprotein n=1 Tax=Polymorphospora rubra TaxID=338584 RepID=A0A810N3D6_9ACTN|nr:hypothetical protein [Polymorphospora rubra]BCJ68191.1 hypothetical protein Prubr_52120 [Polymorphospora rubra]